MDIHDRRKMLVGNFEKRGKRNLHASSPIGIKLEIYF
jgi:hypothetical protein